MNFQAQHPDWSDGPSNKAMIDTLDALGGAGIDLGDVEAFQMLDDIERLTNEKLKAADLLRGDGQASPRHNAEPTLSRNSNSVKKALLAEQIQDFKDLPDTPSFLKSGPAVAASAALASKNMAAPPEHRAIPAQSLAPLATLPGKINESKAIGSGTQEMEISNRKKPLPEDFLPPDFFDPRDRQPRKKWGRWVILGVVFAAMLSLAGYLIVKAYKDSRPSNSNSMSDFPKPIRR